MASSFDYRSGGGSGGLGQELQEQPADLNRLLLLYPMAGALDQMAADHPAAIPGLHRFEHAGALIGAPVLLAGDESGGHVDAAARPGLHFRDESARRAAAIPLQPALESGARIFAAVVSKLAIG